MQATWAYFSRISSLDLLEDVLTCFRIVDERIPLRTMYELEVLYARLPEDRLWRHYFPVCYPEKVRNEMQAN